MTFAWKAVWAFSSSVLPAPPLQAHVSLSRHRLEALMERGGGRCVCVCVYVCVCVRGILRQTLGRPNFPCLLEVSSQAAQW